MKKAILVGLAILAASTTAASAWTHRTHHSRAINPNASVATDQGPYAPANAQGPYARPANAYAMGGPVAPTGGPVAPMGVSSKDHEMYMKNLHDSGYDPKNDFTKSGTIRLQ